MSWKGAAVGLLTALALHAAAEAAHGVLIRRKQIALSLEAEEIEAAQ